MFGFLRPPATCSPATTRTYRQTYALLCSWQRKTFGVRASILISYEAVFLYQLAIDCQLISPVSEKAPTCCRLRNDTHNLWNADSQAASFATAFALLLAKTKLDDDDVRDSRSILSRAGQRFWRTATNRATEHLNQFAPGLVQSIDRLVSKHVLLEQSNFSGLADAYARPTAEAFGIVFKAFAELNRNTLPSSVDCAGQSKLTEKFLSAGRLIGKGILLSDCVFDYESDRRTGQFNPIADSREKLVYQRAAAKAFSEAGWFVEDIAPQRNGVCLQILQHAFRRVIHFEVHDDTVKQPNRKARLSVGRRRLARAGECDIPCDGCCNCGGCDGCAPDGCGSGASIDPDGSPCLNNCLSGCLLSCDPCRPTRSQGNEPTPHRDKLLLNDAYPEEMIGETAVADCDLNPTGYIVYDSKRYPAKTGGTFCEAGTQVKILSQSSFGWLVEPIDSSPPE